MNKSLTDPPPPSPSPNTEWRLLAFTDMPADFQCSMRFINKQLQFQATMVLESDFSSIISLVTCPVARKKWDLRLVEMEEIPLPGDEMGLKFVYAQDRLVFEFHNSIYIQKSLFSTVIHFKSKNYPSVQTHALLGVMTSSYKLEYLDHTNFSFVHSLPAAKEGKRSSSSGDLFQEDLDRQNASIRCTWKASFCEQSMKLFITDCIEEAHKLKHSFQRFIQVAESRCEVAGDQSPVNLILEACERKKLRQRNTQRKYSDIDLEFN